MCWLFAGCDKSDSNSTTSYSSYKAWISEDAEPWTMTLTNTCLKDSTTGNDTENAGGNAVKTASNSAPSYEKWGRKPDMADWSGDQGGRLSGDDLLDLAGSTRILYQNTTRLYQKISAVVSDRIGRFSKIDSSDSVWFCRYQLSALSESAFKMNVLSS